VILVAGAVVVSESKKDIVFGQASGNPCSMQLNQAQVIFCETFDQAFQNTNRSGQLDGTLWGVSRLGGGSSNWNSSTLDGCNGPQPAKPDATDIIVCNGQMRQSLDDNHEVVMLALYPKQPFDFGGRTGTVSFDVTNDTSGTHGAWPEFWLTDKPVPAPVVHGGPPCDFCSVPKNGFGIRFAAMGGDCPSGWRADSAVVIRDYVVEEYSIFDGHTGTEFRQKGCASLSSGPNGGLNHIELRMAQNRVDVYASDAGSKTLKLINTFSNANLPLTRGLIWIGDSHYNASKSPVPSQTNHTYAWDNVAFDGPATYRDLSFDVPDALVPQSGTAIKLGWDTRPTQPVTLRTLPMTSANIAAATSAMFMFNFGVYTSPTTFNFSINGHAMTVANPVPNSLKGWRSVALAVPLNYLVNGQQNIVLSADTDLTITNVNIVLVAAAPVPGFGAPAAPTKVRVVTE